MKKEAQVVMLPTDKTDGTLWKTSNGQLIHTHVSGEYKQKYQPFNLYITTDDEMKEGDWCYSEEGILSQHIFQYIERSSRFNGKKIIGTTDPELLLYVGENPSGTIIRKEGKNYQRLPQIPQSFIESYCKNPVEKVLVEYVKMYRDMTGEHEALMLHGDEYDKPKLTSNNELIIHPIEEKLYTREEVVNILHKSLDATVTSSDKFKQIMHHATAIRDLIAFDETQPEVDYQKMFANCSFPNEKQPEQGEVKKRYDQAIQVVYNPNDYDQRDVKEAKEYVKGFHDGLEQSTLTQDNVREAAEKVVKIEYEDDSQYINTILPAIDELEKALK